MTHALTANLAVLAGCLLALWALSVGLRDASIVDIFWGPGFALVAARTLLAADARTPLRWLLAALVCAWGLRLGAYLAWRNIGAGEDYRYRAMRAKVGRRFPLWSLVFVFGLQGALIATVSLPVQSALAGGARRGPWALAPLGLALWAVGLFFEAVGDAQLARFRADPANAGRVMDRGLWRYTRHPNYFGDFTVWWGLYLLAVAAGAAWWTALGPAVMSVLLLRVSGVTLLEKGLRARRPGYADYARRTSAFFPRPPRE
jgi:steroid 5-alpha reductase family enzyme